ncbi:biopolymer transporter ExbD [Myxococcota bacterium]|nr:biopolymer transporter ExbD [Myxococcota bacterium]
MSPIELDKQQKSHEERVGDWLAQQEQSTKKKRKGIRRVNDEGGITISSLMDAMFIILVFLLMNYAVDPLRIDMSEELKLPASTTDIDPEASAAVTVTANGIIVNDKLVVEVKEGVVDKADKQGEEASLKIQPLFEALNEEANRQKNISQLSGGKFNGVLTIIAHQETPYRLITEILYTAGQAEFQKFKFAVLQGGARGTSS